MTTAAEVALLLEAGTPLHNGIFLAEFPKLGEPFDEPDGAPPPIGFRYDMDEEISDSGWP